MTSDILPAAPHTVEEFVRAYEEGGPLRGFACPQCGLVTATWGLACPRCGHVGREERQLAPVGTVVAFTVVNVPGDEYLNDAPYAYVVVELDGGGRITGWMPSVRSVTELAIGDRVRFHPSYKPGVQFAREPGASTPPTGA
jgi:uncharacterized OB-fold protein